MLNAYLLHIDLCSSIDCYMQVFKTGVDEFLMLCQMFTTLVMAHCPHSDLSVDASKLPSVDRLCSPAQTKSAKGKQQKAGKVKAAARATTANEARQKGKDPEIAASKGKRERDSDDQSPAKDQSAVAECIKGMRLGDNAKRGTSGIAQSV